jgi:phosphoglycolate phosphatase-like HAD superfamily hydrolase
VLEFGVPELRGQVTYSGRTDRAIAGDLFRLHAVGNTAANWQRFTAAYLRLLPEYLGRHRGQVLPGIAALLEQLRGQDQVAVGLLTGNIRAGARAKLGHYGLEQHFAFGGFGDLHLERDEVARDALREAEQHLEITLDRDKIWVIGDTPLDVACARAIGARVAAVATGWHSLAELAAAAPDLLLADLADPRPLLRHWV